jgi:hypothetical protein
MLVAFVARRIRKVAEQQSPVIQILLRTNFRHFIFIEDFAEEEFETKRQWHWIRRTILRKMSKSRCDCASTYGYSTGGWAALAAGAEFPVDFAFAISPLWSSDPRIAPDSAFDFPERTQNLSLKHETADAGLRAVRRAVVLHGDRDLDAVHCAFFPTLPHVDHWQMPECGHGSLGVLKARGIAVRSLMAAFCERPAERRRAFRSLGYKSLAYQPARKRARQFSKRIMAGIVDPHVSYLGRPVDLARSIQASRRAAVEESTLDVPILERLRLRSDDCLTGLLQVLPKRAKL